TWTGSAFIRTLWIQPGSSSTGAVVGSWPACAEYTNCLRSQLFDVGLDEGRPEDRLAGNNSNLSAVKTFWSEVTNYHFGSACSADGRRIHFSWLSLRRVEALRRRARVLVFH